jgi:hypothetical protein
VRPGLGSDGLVALTRASDRVGRALASLEIDPSMAAVSRAASALAAFAHAGG